MQYLLECKWFQENLLRVPPHAEPTHGAGITHTHTHVGIPATVDPSHDMRIAQMDQTYSEECGTNAENMLFAVCCFGMGLTLQTHCPHGIRYNTKRPPGT